jgi:hypothetical protein
MPLKLIREATRTIDIALSKPGSELQRGGEIQCAMYGCDQVLSMYGRSCGRGDGVKSFTPTVNTQN